MLRLESIRVRLRLFGAIHWSRAFDRALTSIGAACGTSSSCIRARVWSPRSSTRTPRRRFWKLGRSGVHARAVALVCVTGPPVFTNERVHVVFGPRWEQSARVVAAFISGAAFPEERAGTTPLQCRLSLTRARSRPSLASLGVRASRSALWVSPWLRCQLRGNVIRHPRWCTLGYDVRSQCFARITDARQAAMFQRRSVSVLLVVRRDLIWCSTPFHLDSRRSRHY